MTTQQDIKPTYYNTQDGRQCIDIMLELYGLDAVINFCEVNAFKYHFRAGNKPGEAEDKDLKKAKWYEDKALELKSYRDLIH